MHFYLKVKRAWDFFHFCFKKILKVRWGGGGGAGDFFSFFSILELGKWVWVLLFHLLLLFLILKGGKGA